MAAAFTRFLRLVAGALLSAGLCAAALSPTGCSSATGPSAVSGGTHAQGSASDPSGGLPPAEQAIVYAQAADWAMFRVLADSRYPAGRRVYLARELAVRRAPATAEQSRPATISEGVSRALVAELDSKEFDVVMIDALSGAPRDAEGVVDDGVAVAFGGIERVGTDEVRVRYSVSYGSLGAYDGRCVIIRADGAWEISHEAGWDLTETARLSSEAPASLDATAIARALAYKDVGLGAFSAPARDGGVLGGARYSAAQVSGGGDLQLYEFGSAREASSAASGISLDGTSLPGRGGPAAVQWKGAPHFFRRGTLVVLYLSHPGKPSPVDGRVLDTIEDLMGPQFSGMR